jgi:hypothetical protein
VASTSITGYRNGFTGKVRGLHGWEDSSQKSGGNGPLAGKPDYYGKIWAKLKQIAAQIGAQVGWNADHDQWSMGVPKKADPTNKRGLAAATQMVGVTAGFAGCLRKPATGNTMDRRQL